MGKELDDGALVLDLRDLQSEIREIDGQAALVLTDGQGVAILSPGLSGGSRAAVAAAEACASAALMYASELRLRIRGPTRPAS
jgi:hypothetical protein